MILCGGLAVLYHHSTENWRLLILGTWLSMFFLSAMLVHKLERKKAITSPAPDHKVVGGTKKVQAMPAEDSSRVTVNT
jgi:hypothetical protein